MRSVYPYLLVMAAVTYAIRVLPLTLLRKPIQSRFLRSFLFYVPYVTLAVMTVPAIFQSTESPLAGAAALALGIYASWRGKSLFAVAAVCCLSVLVLELFLA